MRVNRRPARPDQLFSLPLASSPEDALAAEANAAIPAWEAVSDLGIAMILIATAGDANVTMGKLHRFATRFPDVRVVLDHLGYPDPKLWPETFGFSPMHHALAGHRNIYYKFTSLLLRVLGLQASDLKGFLDYAVALYGAERMVWGSDFGNVDGGPFDYLQQTVDATDHMTYAVRRAMFFDTAYRLFASRKAA